VLDAVEKRNDSAFAQRVFRQTLIEIRVRLSSVHVVYPVPKRVSLARCGSLIDSFLSEQSGGDRLQAVASALFVAVGERFMLYSEVRRANINAADASSGQIADLECVTTEGAIVLAVEVKDRDLTIKQVRDILPNIRAQRVSEFFFIAQRGIAKGDEPDVTELIEKEFASGQNIYVFDLSSLARSFLALLGESGRRLLLESVGRELDRFRSEIVHRRAWANLLAHL
jgi:hypothetical protein